MPGSNRTGNCHGLTPLLNLSQEHPFDPILSDRQQPRDLALQYANAQLASAASQALVFSNYSPIFDRDFALASCCDRQFPRGPLCPRVPLIHSRPGGVHALFTGTFLGYDQTQYPFPHDTGLFLLRKPASWDSDCSLDGAALALGVHRWSFCTLVVLLPLLLFFRLVVLV